MRARFACLTALIALLSLAACAPATPALIGAYRPDASQPIATYVLPPAGQILVYDAYVEMEVRDTAAAADRAAQLAADHDGYLSSSQQWREDGHSHTTVTLAVPSHYFDSLHTALLDLGRLRSERTSGTLVSPAYPGQVIYATITVHFIPSPPLVTLPRLPGVEWDPADTFASAFALFAAIFTFLLDIVIWLAVVVGPFALLGLGLRWMVRRVRIAPATLQPPIPKDHETANES